MTFFETLRYMIFGYCVMALIVLTPKSFNIIKIVIETTSEIIKVPEVPVANMHASGELDVNHGILDLF